MVLVVMVFYRISIQNNSGTVIRSTKIYPAKKDLECETYMVFYKFQSGESKKIMLTDLTELKFPGHDFE